MIADDHPAGIVELRSACLSDHVKEIVNLLRNEQTLENGEHSLERVMRLLRRRMD